MRSSVAAIARGDFGQDEFAAGQIQAGQPAVLRVVVSASSQMSRLSSSSAASVSVPGRDDARHGALDRPLAGRRVADLLADHHRFAEFDQRAR
jgi:hypothetical protein